MKWTSQLLSSFINSVISLLIFVPRNLSAFTSESLLPNIRATNGSIEFDSTSDKIYDVSSLFLALKPFTLYSTSFAVWIIMKVGVVGYFGFNSRLLVLCYFLIFWRRWSSVYEAMVLLSSSKLNIPKGAFSINSINKELSLNLISLHHYYKPSLIKSLSSSLKT